MRLAVPTSAARPGRPAGGPPGTAGRPRSSRPREATAGLAWVGEPPFPAPPILDRCLEGHRRSRGHTGSGAFRVSLGPPWPRNPRSVPSAASPPREGASRTHRAGVRAPGRTLGLRAQRPEQSAVSWQRGELRGRRGGWKNTKPDWGQKCRCGHHLLKGAGLSLPKCETTHYDRLSRS